MFEEIRLNTSRGRRPSNPFIGSTAIVRVETLEERLAPAAFNYGDLVQATAALNVRAMPSTSASIVTTVSPGSIGTVLSSPQVGSGYTWFYVSWKSGASGYSVQDYLAKAPTNSDLTPPSFSSASLNGVGPFTSSQANLGQTLGFFGSVTDNVGLSTLTVSISGPKGNNLTVASINVSGASQSLSAFSVNTSNPNYAGVAGTYTVSVVAKDTSNNVSSVTWNVAVAAPSASAVVSSDKLEYQSGSVITFSGSVRDGANRGVAGVQISIDDPLRMQSVLGPVTDSTGSFKYTTSVPASAKGNYVFAFFGGAAPAYSAVTIKSAAPLELTNNAYNIPLGSTSSVSGLDLALTNKMSSQSGVPSANSGQVKNALDGIVSFMASTGRNAIGNFASSPANDVVALASVGCAAGIWTGVGTIPCAALYDYVLVAGGWSVVFGAVNAGIDASNLSSTDKSFWKDQAQTGQCILAIAMVDPKVATVNLSSFDAGWTCGSAIGSTVQNAVGQTALKVVAMPSAGSVNQAGIGFVLIPRSSLSVQAPTSSYLYSSQSTANVGQSVTFSDYVYANSGSASPSGSVSIYDNGNFIATANLVSNGYAASYVTWSTSGLSIGSHTVKFVYNGSSGFQGSNASVAETINSVTASTVSYLYSSQSTANAGQSVTFWDYIYANSGSASPAGSASIYDNGNFIATANLVSNGYAASYVTWSTSGLSVGSHTIKFVYNGSSSFQGSNASVAETINSVMASTTSYLYSSQTTANAGQSVTFWDYIYANSGSASPAGSVSIYDNGNFIATANLVSNGYAASYVTWSTSGLSIGSHTIKFIYNGSSSFQGSNASVVETINSVTASTVSNLYSSQSTANAGQSVTFWDYIYANSGSASPAGSASIYDNGNFIATANLVSNGYAASYVTWSTSGLSVGSHTVKFVYNGSSGFQGSNASVTLVVNGQTNTSQNPYYNEFLNATYAAGVPTSWATNSALLNLVAHESSWNPQAQNPTSTAYGLFQFLNSTWAQTGVTKTSDPYWQAVAGFIYIKQTYQTPERAWAFWQATVYKDKYLAPTDLQAKAAYWISLGYAGY